MARTRLSPKRLVETKKTNIGRIILFCEGPTEKYYFEYFADIIKRNRNKYDDIEVILENGGGNAQRVLNVANQFMEISINKQRYGNYHKY